MQHKGLSLRQRLRRGWRGLVPGAARGWPRRREAAVPQLPPGGEGAARFSPARPFALALQGGGAHGAFTWGVLDRLLEEPGCSIAAMSGASAGAVNAAVLAAGHLEGGPSGARERLAALWEKLAGLARFSPFHLFSNFINAAGVHCIVRQRAFFDELLKLATIKGVRYDVV